MKQSAFKNLQNMPLDKIYKQLEYLQKWINFFNPQKRLTSIISCHQKVTIQIFMKQSALKNLQIFKTMAITNRND